MKKSMFRNARKSQGLPLNVIIIALIVLVVLVVVWLIFTGKIGSFSSGISQAQNEIPQTLSEVQTPTKGNPITAQPATTSTPPNNHLVLQLADQVAEHLHSLELVL
ncbi:hypothetical protein HYU14_01095 [Candidatus Woesearchaeota archaeon]|nr:hypothetical protein [Candidatus Woesearchaeota archaeon]